MQVEDAATARARFPFDPLIDGAGADHAAARQERSDHGRSLPFPCAVAIRVLLVSTLAFAVCFAVWLMFGVTGIPIRKELGLNASEFGLLTATPVLTGALFRLPLGIWTDRFGGRIVMFILLVACAVPLWISSYATALWQFLLLGLALGLVGASFAVGTPYTSRFFPKEKKGLAMGIFGAGTTGAAINMFVAPPLVASLWLAERAPGLCRRPLDHRRAVLAALRARSGEIGRLGAAPPAARHSARSTGLEILPVLLDRVRRIHGRLHLDAAVFRQRVPFPHRPGRADGGLLRAAGRRLAGARRLSVRSVRGAQRHLVGAVGRLDLPLPAVLSADGFRHADHPRPRRVPHRPARLGFRDAALRARRLVRLRHGLDLQVCQRRLPDQHGRGLRHRRPGRRPGRIPACPCCSASCST